MRDLDLSRRWADEEWNDVIDKKRRDFGAKEVDKWDDRDADII